MDKLVESGISHQERLQKEDPNLSASARDAMVAKLLQAELKEMREKGELTNPLLSMDGVDIHKDTPTEILHTLLLGVVKYLWSQTVSLVADQKAEAIFQARLHSLSSEGLNVPSLLANYMCKHAGSLIGKHFKIIAQIMPFAVFDLVPEALFIAWLLIGILVVLLWHTEIKDMEEYLVCYYDLKAI